jgi:hypothetical protein
MIGDPDEDLPLASQRPRDVDEVQDVSRALTAGLHLAAHACRRVP